MTRQMQDIIAQPESLAKVADRQFGAGAQDLKRAAEMLRTSTRIVLTGMGSSLFAAIPAAHVLAQSGISADVVESSELLYYRRDLLRRGTACVLISRSGESIETARLIAPARAEGVTLIGITNVPDSSVGREVSCPVIIGSDPDQMVAIQTYTGTVLVLLLLAAVVSEGAVRPAGVESLLPAMRTVIQQELERADDWKAFTGASVVYVLGRGASMASVYEGALMFNESARLPSVGMSAAQFRHGPVEVVDREFRGIVFASQHETESLDRALAADLERLGGKVRVCSAAPQAAPLQPVLEIVPVQIAACRLAEWKGITPGQFRHAPQVTATESGFRGI